eukprot:CAMPEP_0203655534 /NCGR_PEP_ID=MMETSP0088-20131115/38632_1 /ASSEMBLY_ACC=CAM_ASM_001087 /TAXON_ID=426623 /ORGANISM="Chaetoceros affinis, Strain CCMP159" /LENGTH=136 /DNA_ID=CAMNT_0050516175 /DNA_START=6 /DNA_END=413 /DNA_ORIENTATION=+
MVQCASAASESDESSHHYYYCASSCDLLEGLERERNNKGNDYGNDNKKRKIPKFFDVAMAVFLFNYLTTDEMRTTMKQIYAALKPGGIFVFSVPHPSMIYCHDKEAIFRLEEGPNGKEHGYFSAVDQKLLGHISTV